MQLTSVAVWHVMDRIGMPMSLNDVCVFVPTWFGGLASVLTGFMAAECSGIPSAAPAAALIMAVIPAHIMRSVGGGYDNECIAVSPEGTITMLGSSRQEIRLPIDTSSPFRSPPWS